MLDKWRYCDQDNIHGKYVKFIKEIMTGSYQHKKVAPEQMLLKYTKICWKRESKVI